MKCKHSVIIHSYWILSFIWSLRGCFFHEGWWTSVKSYRRWAAAPEDCAAPVHEDESDTCIRIHSPHAPPEIWSTTTTSAADSHRTDSLCPRAWEHTAGEQSPYTYTIKHAGDYTFSMHTHFYSRRLKLWLWPICAVYVLNTSATLYVCMCEPTHSCDVIKLHRSFLQFSFNKCLFWTGT